MSHICSTSLVRCIDFRLGSAIRDFLNENNLYDDVDIIAIAGASKDLNDNSYNAVETQIGLSKDLHQIKTLILMNHTDCGAYGGRSAFESIEAEREHHLSELASAAEKMSAKYPDVEVKKMLADIKEDGSVVIETIV